ncbi:MAG: AMP-binding protein [Dehalococcoidia bacterium]
MLVKRRPRTDRRLRRPPVRRARLLFSTAGGCAVEGPAGAGNSPPPYAGPDDDALLLYTSGIDRPKGVQLTHRNLLASARNVAQSYALTADERSLCVMPLFHVHGLVASVMATLHGGSWCCQRRLSRPPASGRWCAASPTGVDGRADHSHHPAQYGR